MPPRRRLGSTYRTWLVDQQLAEPERLDHLGCEVLLLLRLPIAAIRRHVEARCPAQGTRRDEPWTARVARVDSASGGTYRTWRNQPGDRPTGNPTRRAVDRARL
jgi:hypothetical protein